MRAFVLGILVVVVAASTSTRAQAGRDSPEPTIRALVMAILGNDVAGYERVTIPDPRRSRLTAGGRVNESKLRELREDPDLLQMRKGRPFLFKGVEAALEPDGRYPVGTTALYTVAFGGSPMVVRLVRQPEGWRVDLRWWLAMLDLRTGPPKPGTPEFAARAITMALLTMDRKAVAKYAVPGASLDLLFMNAEREPSGQLEALAMEMPVVELRPGEFYPMMGHVAEGTATPNVKVLLGMMGPVEIPFIVRRVGSDWRVEPQPYFAWFMR